MIYILFLILIQFISLNISLKMPCLALLRCMLTSGKGVGKQTNMQHCEQNQRHLEESGIATAVALWIDNGNYNLPIFFEDIYTGI